MKLTTTHIVIYTIVLVMLTSTFNYVYLEKARNNYNNAPQYTSFFGFNKFEMNDEEFNKLEAFFSTKQKKYKEITIIGYTDSIGTDKVNIRFGYLRATETLRRLNQIGIQVDDFKIISRGCSELLYESTQPCDRKVDIYLNP